MKGADGFDPFDWRPLADAAQKGTCVTCMFMTANS